VPDSVVPENMDAPCNICGRGWPYHVERCSYRVTFEERDAALAALTQAETERDEARATTHGPGAESSDDWCVDCGHHVSLHENGKCAYWTDLCACGGFLARSSALASEAERADYQGRVAMLEAALDEQAKLYKAGRAAAVAEAERLREALMKIAAPDRDYVYAKVIARAALAVSAADKETT